MVPLIDLENTKKKERTLCYLHKHLSQSCISDWSESSTFLVYDWFFSRFLISPGRDMMSVKRMFGNHEIAEIGLEMKAERDEVLNPYTKHVTMKF